MTTTGTMRALLTDLVVLDWSGRPRARVLAWLVALTLYAAWRSAGMVLGPLPFAPDGHAMASFNEAVNEVWCGKRASFSDVYQPASRLAKDPSLVSIPVEALIERMAGSVPAYCATVTTPFANNENSLTMLDVLALRLRGRSGTPGSMGRALLALRIAILLAFCGAVLIAGGSVLMCVAVIELGVALCQQTTDMGYTLYPFIFVMPLLTVACYVLLLDRVRTRTRAADWLLLAGVGFAAALGANIRTSHLPVYVVLFGLFLWFWRPAAIRHAAAAAVVVCAAYLIGHWVIVESRQPPVTSANYSYHVVAHPLVLSLAVPDNRLAQSEGIRWLDEVGAVLAHRVDPSATYLSASYETALFRYYRSLWRRHPRTMAAIYLLKFDVAGDGLVQSVSRDKRAIWASLDLWTIFGSGFERLWAMIALLVGSALAYRRWRSVFAALVAMLTLIALLLNVEMAVIMPSFTLKYHSFTVFYAGMIGIAAVQFAVNPLVALAASGWRTALPPIAAPLAGYARAVPDRRRISVIAPVYNESASLTEFVRRLVAVSHQIGGRHEWEFVLVDDGSTDDGLSIAKGLIAEEPRLRVIELRRNFGQTSALQAGLAAARGDVVISMDSDLQHFPEDIPAFLSGIDEGYDLVCGWRHERQEGVLRRWPSRAANVLIRRVAGVDIHDFGTTFRAYRSDLVRHIQLLGEQHRFVPALAMQIGARVTEIPIRNIERLHGTSNYGLARTLNVFLDIIFLYFSRKYFTGPLKAFGKIALLLMSAGGAIAGSLLAYSWITGIPTVRERGGWFLLAALLLLASLQIMLTGLLAEILVRVYYRSGHTDSYVIRDEWNVDTVGRAAAAAPPARTGHP